MSSAEKENQGGISVVIMAKKATIIELRLTYRMWSSTPKVDFLPNSSLVVQNATCLVVYELQATTEAGLHRRYPYITVPGSHSAPGKIGRTLS